MQPNQVLTVLFTKNDASKRSLSQVEGAQGKVYKKQILKFGNYVDPFFPDWPMTLDKSWGDRVVQNFNAGVVGRVAVPYSHTDDPEKNTGECIAMDDDDEGLNGTLDIRDPEAAQKIDDDLIWDDSISFTNNYMDENGVSWGPVIFHVALVNNPYITGMTGFEALSKAKDQQISALRHVFSKTHTGSAIVLSKSSKEISMGKKVKNTQAFDVPVKYQDADGKDVEATVKPGEEIEVPESVAEGVEQQVTAATAPAAEGGEGSGEGNGEGAGAGEGGEGEGTHANNGGEGEGGEGSGTSGNEGSPSAGALSKKERDELEAYRAGAADRAFSKLLEEGKVVPAQKDQITEFAKANGADAVTKMFSNARPVIDFSEHGSQNNGKGNGDGGEGNGSDEGQGSGEAKFTPYADLSKSDKDVLERLKLSKEDYETEAKKNPQFFSFGKSEDK